MNAYPTQLDAAWGVAFDTDNSDFWVSNAGSLGGDDLEYRYLTDGTQTGDTIDDSSWVEEFAADGAFNARTGMLWRVNVGGDNCLYELDPFVRAPTGNKICVLPWAGVSQRGLAYDVLSRYVLRRRLERGRDLPHRRHGNHPRLDLRRDPDLGPGL